MAKNDDSWAPTTEHVRAAGLGLSVGGVVAQSIAAYQQGLGNELAYGAQSDVLRTNAGLKEYQARHALARGARTQNNIWQKGASLKSDQIASMAARGLDITQGSPLSILSDTEFFTNANAAEAGDQAANEAWALRVQASGDEANADLMSARAHAERPGRDAGTTLLTGLGKVAASWYSDPTRTIAA